MKYKRIFKILLFFFILAAFMLASHYLNFGYCFDKFRDWVKSIGYWGPLVYIVFYALAVTALFPGSVLTIAAGAVFGSFWGVVIVSAASTLGSALSFIIARYFARDFVSQWVQKQKKFKKLDEMVQAHSDIIVAISRLIPLFPYTLLNYAFGLTKVSFKTYILWSWLCMLPGTVLYVVGSDTVVKAVTKGKVQPGHAIVIIIAFVLIVITAKFAEKILLRRQKAPDKVGG